MRKPQKIKIQFKLNLIFKDIIFMLIHYLLIKCFFLINFSIIINLFIIFAKHLIYNFKIYLILNFFKIHYYKK